jgi:hypothetical protein
VIRILDKNDLKSELQPCIDEAPCHCHKPKIMSTFVEFAVFLSEIEIYANSFSIIIFFSIRHTLMIKSAGVKSILFAIVKYFALYFV